MIKWILTNATRYRSLEEKDTDALYFLEDTKEIYKGSDLYTGSVVFVDSLPELAATDKIYVVKSTHQCSVWTGEKWETLFPQISASLTDDESSEGLVTGDAIKAYVIKKIADLSVDGSSVELTTDNIKTTKEIQVKGQTLGSYKDGDVIPAGESLTSILTKQFAKQIPPTYAAPTYAISPGSKTYESGEKITLNVSGTFTQKDAGVLKTYTLRQTVTGGVTADLIVDATSINPYNAEDLTVFDGTSIKFTGTVTYGNGEIKNDNLGEPYPQGSIKAGSLSSSLTLTGQRKCFYGKDKLKAACANSAEVRALPQNVLNPANGTRLTVAIAEGDTRITFAYPATLRDVSSVISSTLNLDVKGTFNKEIVQVEGANGYKAIDYKVYTYIPAIPFTSADTYTINI